MKWVCGDQACLYCFQQSWNSDMKPPAKTDLNLVKSEKFDLHKGKVT